MATFTVGQTKQYRISPANNSVTVPYIRSSGGGDEPPVRIGHPSYDDHERAILDLEGDVKIFQQEEQMWTERLFENPADLEARAGLADVREGIAQHRQHITLLGASDREIGTVFATSGFTVNSKLQLLDWGLVELLPERIGTNKVSTTSYWHQ